MIRARSKYSAKRTVVDNVTFASKREAARYQALKLRLRAGDIRHLKLQPRYALCPLVIDGADVRDVTLGSASIRRLPVAHYVADFEYEQSDGGGTWRLVVEDSKGMKTETYRLKKRWFEAQYNVRILET